MVTDTSTDHARPKFPRYDWVFRSDLVLGQVAAGERTARFQGHNIPYRASDDIGAGARWCSNAWLRRTDTGKRGPAIRSQGGISRLGMRVRGVVNGGTIVVVPDDQIATATRLAADLVTRYATDQAHGASEWSIALVREPGHTQLAIGFNFLPEGARNRLREELDIEWFIIYQERFGAAAHKNDFFRIYAPDRSHSTWRAGRIHHDHEHLPPRLVELAHDAGVARPETSTPDDSPALLVPNDSYRPLEPDEQLVQPPGG